MTVKDIVEFYTRFPPETEVGEWLFAKEVEVKEEHVEECRQDIASNPACGCFFDDCCLIMSDCQVHNASHINPDFVDEERS